jgi:hypothetical protein
MIDDVNIEVKEADIDIDVGDYVGRGTGEGSG